ncbi:MAG: phage shock protein A [Gammaproteobacteria bacterium]|jgi:phage shock protein A
MALINRLGRLFQADFHAVLDRIEEPELQLKQAVREMQLALAQDEQRLALLEHEVAQLDKAIVGTEKSIASFDEELDICLAAKKDDLARDLIRRKILAEQQSNTLRQQQDLDAGQSHSLKNRIVENQQQLTSMQQKLELLADADHRSGHAAAASIDSVRSDEIEIALLREKQQRVNA